MALTYLLADDHKIFRQALRGFIDTDDNFQCVGEAGTGHELLALLKKRSVDAVIMDYSMPELNGIQTLSLLKSQSPDLPVLTLTMHDSQYILAGLAAAGTNAILLKGEAEVSEIKKALQLLKREPYYFNSHLTPALLRSVQDGKSDGKTWDAGAPLTEREIEVLQLICEGKQATAICTVLPISMRTLERMRADMMRRFGVQSTAELAVCAMRHGFYR